MPRFLVLAILLVLAVGCGKKPASPSVAVDDAPPASTDTTIPKAAEPSQRDKLLAALTTNARPKQREAIDDLATLAATDEVTRDALLDLLRDKTTAGTGKTHPTQISSTREAAAVVLLNAGAKGEAVLVEKGLPALRDGLFDKDPAVREHTARTLEVIGPSAKPVSRQLLRVCGENKDPQVRAIAFDALRTVGVSDVPGLASLLHSKEPETRRARPRSSACCPTCRRPPWPRLPALENEDEVIRIAAAMAIGTAGTRGATKDAADRIVVAISKGFPPMYDPKLSSDDPRFEYFTALGRMGKIAVPPTTDLLKHKNLLVRTMAMRTLGELGPIAKDAAKAIRDSLTDPEVPLEAAVALYKVGEEDLEAAVRLVESALASTDPRAVIGGIEAASRMGKAGARLAPTVLKHLADMNPLARLAATEFIGTMEPTEGAKQTPQLQKLLSDEEPTIRFQAGEVLAKLGPAAGSAAEAVGKALRDEKDEAVREQFIDTLIAMGPKAKPAVLGLASQVGDTSLTVPARIKVIEALILADPASKETSAALVLAAADRDQFVRRAAATALGKLNPLPDDAQECPCKVAEERFAGRRDGGSRAGTHRGRLAGQGSQGGSGSRRRE